MDSATTAVATSPLLALLGFLGVIVLLLFLIAKWRWHVFLALLVPLLIFGIIPGWKMITFRDAASSMTTVARPVSEPVPAVVGTATMGNGLSALRQSLRPSSK